MQPTVKISNLPKVVSPALTAKVPLVNGTETDYSLLSDLITLFFNNVPTGVIPGLTADYVISGGVWTGDSYAVNRNASMTALVVYLGQRSISITAVVARTFTASKDTYIDVLNNLDGTGTLVYTEVSNNAASPALASNSIRIGIVVTGATTIAAATSINQGQKSRILPIASSIPYQVTDSLGNLICCRDPRTNLLGYRQVTSGTASSGSAETQIVGLTCPVKIPTLRRVKVTLYVASTVPGAAFGEHATAAWNGTVGSGTQVSRMRRTPISTGTTQTPGGCVVGFYETASATDTFNGAVWNNNSGSSVTNMNNDIATNPAWISVELD